MKRRTFLKTAAASAVAVCAARADESDVLELTPGPHLFLDDRLIEELHADRIVERPTRLEHPVLDSATFGVTQPYVSVVRDERSGRFRIWYNRGPAIWHAESDDGVDWRNPQVAWDIPRGYGCSVVDDGPVAADPARRFKLASWQATRELEDTPRDDAGIVVGFSPDGFAFQRGQPGPVLPTWPDGPGKMTLHGAGDTVDVWYDTIARRYAMAVKVHALEQDGYAPAPKAGRAIRRLIGMSTSEDFLHWDKPWRIHVPDDHDAGLLEFYGMGGMHARGDLRIGLVRVLRDDLPCDEGGPVDGIGYTALATSRDGRAWQRMRAPFLDRNPTPGSWDHAMAWMSAVVPVGDELYFYYGGYARGHKIAPESERQIGLARLPRDRYVALAPREGDNTGAVLTRVMRLTSDTMTANLKTEEGGEVSVSVMTAKASILGGFEEGTVRGDQLAAPLQWKRPLADLRGQPVRLLITLRKAHLYGLTLS